MTGFFIFNLVLSVLIVLSIVGGLAWSIATSRVSVVAPGVR